MAGGRWRSTPHISQSPIRNPHSALPNPQSPIPNPQSYNHFLDKAGVLML
ncbi:MAG: hypothetical protein M5U34_44295 [Chloroflexi bacterium]|nr:hypothetical protein [Chloroflexota bacterium]